MTYEYVPKIETCLGTKKKEKNFFEWEISLR